MTTCYIWHHQEDTESAKRIRAEIMDMCRVQCTLPSEGRTSRKQAVYIILYSGHIQSDVAFSEQIKKLKISGLPILLCIDGCVPDSDILENKITFRWTDMRQKECFFTLIDTIAKQESVTGKTLSLSNEVIPEYTPTMEDVLNQDNIDRLTKLSQMFNDGLLSEIEYTTLKGSIIEACRVHLNHIIESQKNNIAKDSKPLAESKDKERSCDTATQQNPKDSTPKDNSKKTKLILGSIILAPAVIVSVILILNYLNEQFWLW